jgi:NAD(P)-dependent dehydrogenase (short-subunit alcohol dehydrogenase family)
VKVSGTTRRTGIMNAGRPGDGLEEQLNAGRLSAVALDEVRTVFDTNVFGVIAVTQALLPLLREAPAPRILNIASSGGSLTLSSDPANPRRARFGTYAVSNAALNALTVAFGADLESVGIKVNSADLGARASRCPWKQPPDTDARFRRRGVALPGRVGRVDGRRRRRRMRHDWPCPGRKQPAGGPDAAVVTPTQQEESRGWARISRLRSAASSRLAARSRVAHQGRRSRLAVRLATAQLRC